MQQEVYRGGPSEAEGTGRGSEGASDKQQWRRELRARGDKISCTLQARSSRTKRDLLDELPQAICEARSAAQTDDPGTELWEIFGRWGGRLIAV
jgi:hypothetical protein